MTLRNAKNVPLNRRQGSIPQLNSAFFSWAQQMYFILVAKSISGGYLVESGNAGQSWAAPDGTVVFGQMAKFKGLMVPYKPRELDIKAAGERAWKWYLLYAEPTLAMKPDDAVVWNGTEQYRVMSVDDWANYGFLKYVLYQDYEFSGPLILMTDDQGNVVTDNQGDEVPA